MQPENEKDFNNFRFLETSLVAVLPFTDADTMADNFGIGKGKMIPKKVFTMDRTKFFLNQVARTESHVYLGGEDKTIEHILKSKPLGSAFSPVQRKFFDQSDILLHFGHYLWASNDRFLAREIMDKLKTSDDVNEKEFAEQFATGLREVENMVVGFRLQDGIDSRLLLTVPKESQAAKLFKTMKGKRGVSTLHGLPEGNVLFAQAASGEQGQNSLLTKVLFNFMLEEVLIHQKIVHNVDRLTYLGVFHEVWRRLQGNRLAVYQNSNEKRDGLFSAVAVLDTEDAKIFLRDMKVLSKMALADSLDLTKREIKDEIDIDRLVRDLRSSVYIVRQSATTKLSLIGEPALAPLNQAIASKDFDLESKRRARDLRDRISAVAAARRKELLTDKDQPLFVRPKLTFVASVEKRHDTAVDVIHIEMTGLDKVAKLQYSQLLGPDWDKVRLAVVGKQIVVLLGSDLGLFDAAIRNVHKGEAGLAASKNLAPFQEYAAKDRLFEFHICAEGILRLISPDAKLDSPLQMISVGLTINDQSLQIDARIPTPEVRAIARKAQEGMQ
jgi:hypothetical protein